MTRRPTAKHAAIANLPIVLLFLLTVANSPITQADEPATSPEAPSITSDKPTATAPDAGKSEISDGEFRPLIQDWEAASFGGDGAIEFKKIKKADDAKHDDQLIVFAAGDPLTGIRWTGPLPRENYELRMQARRVDGFDFFVAVTFPVGQEHCSFVLGGWGGGILGISSINGDDAANNETTQYKDFKNGQWYQVRIRVDEKAIVCWIDDEEWANVERDRNSFDIRIEMDPCLPLGLANFQCTSEIKSVQIRKLKP
ncbi:family 16 glycoside hydrolase [Neorhodopirellula pilleata]|uniref:3-keto-alpha-glucoside-1,2-lyase/3-keto-2-hydroxy-glucal hydratase domain-containing protein n=1 Tax=Neorhodopirellula pilleata TaxID=2714738 RepID=A0A5C6A2U0_9BACT|nr:family 16 glycoside hydrolase [Neorhodopirellula pilleata]TWT94234.1 hypothetical protein Pla100_38440 [Neorhodopirellula pilleata]